MLSQQIQDTVDLDMLIKLSRDAGEIHPDIAAYTVSNLCTCNPENIDGAGKITGTEKVRIGVAKDKAFCFYYRDNLDLLEMLGAELEFFSPVSDAELLGDIDGLYIGGGYPEIWAERLQQNISMRKNIKSRILSGMPAYAECGGLMYMSDSITCKDGGSYDMVGLIPGKSLMTDSLQRFGYVFVKLKDDTILAPKGSEIRAHEFHYSITEVDGDVKTCYEVSNRKDRQMSQAWDCGFKVHNLLAGYAHMHFWSNMEFAKGFVKSCMKFKLER